MKLVVENFGKIEHAELMCQGITAIAGDNNTGKSTIGKILFSIFNALNDIEKKITQQRANEIAKIISTLLKDILVSQSNGGETQKPIAALLRNRAVKISKDLANLILSEELLGEKELITLLCSQISNYAIVEDSMEMISEVADNILRIVNLSDERIIIEIVNRYFQAVFHEQINNVDNSEQTASVVLTIKNKELKLVFHKNECILVQGIYNIVHTAMYIDNPFIIDDLEKPWVTLDIKNTELLGALGENGTDILHGVVSDILAKDKMTEIYEKLNQVIGGEILVKNGTYYYDLQNGGEPIQIENLSTGMKSFAILKILIDRGKIKEKDVLILDEPEIHLHPQWQVIYAELIVLLEKYFGLTIIITTHSPYFLDAIELFSCKYDMKAITTFYLSELTDNKATINDVTDNIDLIYEKMMTPIQLLDSLRYELNQNKES